MMKSIVDEKLVSFNELEQKIFKYVCELDQEITQIMLESYDEDLAASRDTKQHQDKGKRKTTIRLFYVWRVSNTRALADKKDFQRMSFLSSHNAGNRRKAL